MLARDVASIEELLSRHPHPKAFVCDVIDTAGGPFRRPMVRRHLSYKSRALLFILVRLGIVGLRLSGLFEQRNVNVVGSIHIWRRHTAVDGLFTFLTGMKDETLKDHEVAFSKGLQKGPVRRWLAWGEMPFLFLRLGVALKRFDFTQPNRLWSSRVGTEIVLSLVL